MNCPFCGKDLPNGAHFCAGCGNEITFNNVQTPQINPAYAQQNPNINLNLSDSNIFVSNDEYVVATLKNGVASNLLSGEGFKSEDAVLTNKRLYYNHKTGIVNIRTQEEKINIKDITGSKIANINPIGILILAALIGIISIFGLFPLLIVALFLVLAYFIAKKSHLKIEYAGGAIYFSVKKYGKENIRNFQKSIYAIKDNIEANKM